MHIFFACQAVIFLILAGLMYNIKTPEINGLEQTKLVVISMIADNIKAVGYLMVAFGSELAAFFFQ